MKRPIAIILSLCMLLSLSACAGLDALRNTELPPPPTPEIEAEETPAPSAAELPAPSPEETPAPSALSEGLCAYQTFFSRIDKQGNKPQLNGLE